LSAHHKPITLWRISDGKAGHDAQSRGLTTALARIVSCEIFDIHVTPQTGYWSALFGPGPDAARNLPDPDLIIGAGHRTHLPMLRARRARGGKIIVIMKPTLPTRWFDLCFIPEHDQSPDQANIKTTRGAINTIVPSTVRDPDKGLILIGGPSRHYRWDENRLLLQLLHIAGGSAVRWEVTDSPRTPDSTRARLSKPVSNNLVFTPYNTTPLDWVSTHLQTCGQVWVTEDSVSMLYEALSSGSAVGLLEMPAKKKSDRIAIATRHLAEKGLITTYEQWTATGTLKTPTSPLYEADRCARIVAKEFALPLQQSAS
jgi:uncharacterized protein